MRKILDTPYFAMSRRQWLLMTALGSLGFCLGVRAAAEPDPLEAEEQLEKIGETVASLDSSEPDLAGFGVAMTVTAAAFSDRIDEDTDLLRGALYDQFLEDLR